MATYPVDAPPRGGGVAERLGLGRWIPAGDFAPTWAAGGSTTAVVDGALHNRDALTRALGADAAGVENDAELVLRAYRAWGPGGLERLRGAYAVGLWDAADGALLCARDPMGIRPLFYAVDGSEVVLSTSIDALVADPAVPATVSALAVADHLCHRWPDPGETYFEAVRRIPGGHLLRADAAGRTVSRLWDPLPGEDVDWIGEGELDRFDEVFATAVRRCLDDGPVGVFLSGRS